MSDNVIDAEWAEGLPDADNDARIWKLGKLLDWKDKAGPIITRITVQEDLPGLHCNMRRVCVWSGETLVAEAPLHNLQAVGYPSPSVQP